MALVVSCKGPARVFRRASTSDVVRLDEASFHRAVWPALESAGCGSGACHGSNLIGMHLSGGTLPERYRDALTYVRRGAPARSPLLMKALGHHHQGGANLAQDQCEARVIAQWIRGGRPEPCPRREDRRVRAATVLPAMPTELDAMVHTCATQQCHGAQSSPLLVAPNDESARAFNARALSAYSTTLLPSRSRLFRALRGEAGHPTSITTPDTDAFRAAFRWVTGESTPGGDGPSWTEFSRTIHGILVRRGCTSDSCHGSITTPLTLLGVDDAREDNYLRIRRVLSERSFPSKPRNTDEAHGGGRRLGGAEDCASRVIDAWTAGREPERCPPPPPPDRGLFATVVQPSLEALTCHRCHENGTGGFWFSRAPAGRFIERNYQSVVANIDLEYPPASHVLFRVREDCMQAKMLAWVGRQAIPTCTVRLANFRGSFPQMPSAQ